MSRRVRLAILISGRGSNMAAILEASGDPEWPGEPVLVISNRPDAHGLQTAAEAGLATATIDHKRFGPDREAFERQLDSELNRHAIEFIALAGFMRVLTPWFVNRWAGRLVNIHPSLLPKYPGLDTHARAIAAGDKLAGCSVHHVTQGVDEGEVIARATVTVMPGDTPDTLAARVLAQEHSLYPRALATALETYRGSQLREES